MSWDEPYKTLSRNKRNAKYPFPLYVRIGNRKTGTAMRRIWITEDGKKAKYYRDAGCWEISTKVTRIGIRTCDMPASLRRLNNLEIFPVSIKEWRKDNSGYV